MNLKLDLGLGFRF